MGKKSVAIILKNSKNELLLQLRDEKPEIVYLGYWGFIGGGVEDGETELQAIKREIKEEIDCDIGPTKELGKFYLKKEDIIVTIFLSRIDKKIEEIKLTEGQAIRFFDLEDIFDLKLVNVLKQFIIENKKEIFDK